MTGPTAAGASVAALAVAALAPPFPEGVVAVMWALGVLAAVTGALWAIFAWLLARIDERFKSAIRSDDFGHFIDDRIVRAFDGAVSPFLRAQHDLSDRLAIVERSNDTAHRRIDELADLGARVEMLADEIERMRRKPGGAA